MNSVQVSQHLKQQVMLRFVGAIPLLGAIFFVPAGTFAYWQAWIYLAIICVPMLLVVNYFLKTAPDFLERRMRMREPETPQRVIVGLSYVAFGAMFLLPGLDRRFGWSDVPIPVVLIADVFVVLGYGFVFLVFKANRYASRVVEVEAQQTVITTGPYALVRHPMYAGVLVMYLASPLALGSYWAMLPNILLVGILVARIINEEALLRRELLGYIDYTHKVRFRLIPKIW